MKQKAIIIGSGKQNTPEQGSNNSQVEKLKADLVDLYKTLDNYYANNYYYELLKRPNPNKLLDIVLKKVKTGVRTLELGLNPGVLTIECALKKSDAIGVDISPMRVVIAENLKHIEYERFLLLNKFDDLKLEFENIPNAKFKVISPSAIDLPDNSIDLAFSDAAFKNIEIGQIIKELAKLLKPGAEFYIRINKKDENKLQISQKETKISFNSHVFSRWAKTIGFKKVYSYCQYYSFIDNIVSLLPFLRNIGLLTVFEEYFIVGLRKVN